MIEPIDILTTLAYGMGLFVGLHWVESSFEVVLVMLAFLLVQIVGNLIRGIFS